MEGVLLPKQDAQDAADLLIDKIISQIDINRGEMNRLEFISLLIRNRLEKYRRDYHRTDEEEVYCFIKEVMEILGTYLEFFCKAKLSNLATDPEFSNVERV